jgi:hypothetical protein
VGVAVLSVRVNHSPSVGDPGNDVVTTGEPPPPPPVADADADDAGAR